MAGAEVIEVPVYRWDAARRHRPARPADSTPSLAGGIDVLAFTSAPAAASLLARAAERGMRDELLAALRGPVLALCVGPVTAAPLEAARHADRAAPALPARRHGAAAGGRDARAGAAACRSPGTGWSCAGTPCSSTACCGRCRRPGWRCCGRSPGGPGGW